MISLPCGKLNPESESVICQLLAEKKQQGIQVLIKCNDYAALPDAWKKYTWGTNNAVFPLVMIDEKSLGMVCQMLHGNLKTEQMNIIQYVQLCAD